MLTSTAAATADRQHRCWTGRTGPRCLGSHDFDHTHSPIRTACQHIHDQHAQVMIFGVAEVLPDHGPLQGLALGRFCTSATSSVGDLDWIGKGYKTLSTIPMRQSAAIYWRQINKT